MKYLVDSDWLIDASRGDIRTLSHLGQHSDDGLAISIINVGEVYEGVVNGSDDAALTSIRGFLNDFMLLNLTDPIMERFARLRSNLRRQGQLIPDFDLLIAATALEHDLILMTGNVGHFERVPGLVLYQA
jgi:predicted nucleic acid-binding protein